MRDGETDVGDRHFSKGGVKPTTDNQNERIKYREKKEIKQAKAKAVSKAQQEKWLGGVWWYGGGGVE